MTYAVDFRSAAHRNLEAGEILVDGRRRDVAGYLFGWAAECAIKRLMQLSGMRPLPEEARRDDPYYAHFEQLKTLLRDQAWGRRAGDLRKFVDNQAFMQNWHTSMRYSDGRQISDRLIGRWHEGAKAVVAEMEY